MSVGPSYFCMLLQSFSPDDWASVDEAFSDAPTIELQQAWRAERQPEFRPAVVRIGQRENCLWIYAELCDEDIFNPELKFNEQLFLKGDVFEIFLKPQGQDAYYEFHVGPDNQQFQLRIPSAEVFVEMSPNGNEAWRIPSSVFRSWTTVDPEKKTWYVLAAIPFNTVVEANGSRDEWLFSFSRYDYTRGAKGPILSSTSPHEKLGFHRQHEWGRLTLPQ